MRTSTTVLALFTGLLAVQATPLEAVERQVCNPDYSPSSCGACHYWRQCLDLRTQEWIEPCPNCDSTSWCNCSAQAGQNDMVTL